MFGVETVKLKTVNPALDGEPQGEEEILYNTGHDKFMKTIVSSDAPIIKVHDDVDRQLALRTLHDACFHVQDEGFIHGGETHPTHRSLRPLALKPAYNIHGEGSLFDLLVQRFIELDVNRYTGLTLIDWLQMTRNHQESIIRHVQSRRRITQQANQNVINEVQDALGE